MASGRSAVCGLFLCMAIAWPQRPTESDADATIERTRQKALDYAHSLPDFVCTETIHRYFDKRGRGMWSPLDKLTIKLTYFEEKEDHKLVRIDDQPTNRDFDSLDGSIGQGEFGGMLHGVFDQSSKTEFRWHSWKTSHGRRLAVYSYNVDVANSRYLIGTGVRPDLKEAMVGFHGMIETDPEDGSVLYMTYIADRIPKEVRVDYTQTTVDYEFADVGGVRYLLPAKSETEMRSQGLSTKNTMEFRDYGKFSSDSTISFGTGK